MPTTASYGAWGSPITPELLVADAVGLGSIQVDGEQVFWLESRPQEKGRSAIVKQKNPGDFTDVTPSPWNVRSRVHEYGGGAFGIHQGDLWFIHQPDQQVYYLANGTTEPQALTAIPSCRFTNGAWDRARHRLIFVQEEHHDQDTINSLVAIPCDPESSPLHATIPLVTGADFYSSPTLSPDGRWLAWLSWNHPQLPWDGCELWVAPCLEDGALGKAILVAGGKSESVGQPRWLDGQTLLFISDRSGWGNLYQWKTGEPDQISALINPPLTLEFGLPHWVFGQSSYGIICSEQLICAVRHRGLGQLGLLGIREQTWEFLDLPFTEFQSLQANGQAAYFVASSPTSPSAIIELELQGLSADSTSFRVIRSASSLDLSPDFFSVPQALCFPTTDQAVAYGFYYPPNNPNFVAPKEEKPPLIVKCHGGPTAATGTGFNLGIQFWTSRGFAFLDVNYRGSTGFGRAYQDALQGHWGIYDVADCVAGATYLVDQGWVDPKKLAMRGSSAGGYTTLAALTFTSVFQAGASYYGVSDLEALATDTHKFEARYLDGLVAPYPDGKEIYRQRSPIHHVDQLACPVIFFQGLEDKVVPPNQAERMVSALLKKGIPVAYLTFPEEAHGFRQDKTIQEAIKAELSFYAQIFEFTPADNIEAIPMRKG